MYFGSFKRCRLQQGMTTMTTTHNSGHNMLPLRETCNRCRELKVRYRANPSATNTIGAPEPGARAAHGPSPDRTFSVCLLCSRAGAVCTYGPKQRSGRSRTSHLKPQARDSSLSTCQAFAYHGAVHKPPGGSASPSPAVSPQSCHEATRTSGFRASISLDPPVCQPFDWAHVLSLPDLMPENMANNTDTDEMAALLDGQSRSSSATDAMTTTDHSSPPVRDMNLGYGIAGPTLPGEHQMHCDSDDDMVKHMGELMSLNVRVYLLQAQLGTTPPMLALCDEMASITRSFLSILERMVEAQSLSTQAQRTASFPSDTVHVPPGQQTEDSLDLDLRRQLVEVAIYAKDSFKSVCDTIDASTFLIILACYQRLVDLFKHVCLSVHTHLQDHETGGSDLPSLTTAQVVMTTELISHLLGRLDPGTAETHAIQPTWNAVTFHNNCCFRSTLATVHCGRCSTPHVHIQYFGQFGTWHMDESRA
ncbi:hypothetical protein V8F33_007496 [Rhypophila sp. PSN 637]